MRLHDLLDRLERSEALDRVAAPVARAVRPALEPTPVRKALSGTWLGHRLHPLLTDGVIAAWVAAGVLDLISEETSDEETRTLVGLGIVLSLPTAASGLSDWLDYGPKVRRAGVAHAAANTVALSLQIASYSARRRGHRTRGRRLSSLALAALGAGGYLGGHLSYVLGAGVDRTAFDAAPKEWTPALALAELDEGAHRAVTVDGVDVLLARRGEGVLALADSCNHAGCSLAGGEVTADDVRCPCHGSAFRLVDGKVLRGPAASPQPAYAARVRDGMIEVRESWTAPE
ncbi:MAG TPA: Rieske (2Fe-2S) protein [Egibacteraceae bacterium]|nr:Rieske (2Fe-2S) protein [Egibacteraceae bacterium]